MATRRRTTKSSQTVTESNRVATLKLQSPEQNVPKMLDDLDDSVFERMELFVLQVERKLENLETVSSEFIDDKFHLMAQELAQLKDDVLSRTQKVSEAMVQIIESHMGDMNTKALSLSERWRRGVDFYESMRTSMEASHIEASLEKARERLLARHEMPIGWQNNPHIKSGYKFCANYADCVRGAFQIHNETCNIWTHAIAFFVMLLLAFWHLPLQEEWLKASWTDVIPVTVFLVAALKCLMCSVTWHTFCNISSEKVHKNMACVDYTGIMLLITASILTVEYAALNCHPKLQAFYLTITSISGLAGVAFTWHPTFDKLILLRISFFIGFAGAGAIAGMHAMCYEGIMPILELHMPVFKSVASYLLGVVFYAGRIPERFFSDGRFDYVGMSHNLWHLAVFGGIYYHYQACITMLKHGVDKVCSV